MGRELSYYVSNSKEPQDEWEYEDVYVDDCSVNDDYYISAGIYTREDLVNKLCTYVKDPTDFDIYVVKLYATLISAVGHCLYIHIHFD